ncbi:MAG: hypothetical protein MJ196_04220 [Treponemataceae bacterium]|nr:hypothetical protein [Treponemataceae bacterium]
MPEKISSDEVAKNNAAVEAITKDQTDAAIAVLSGKNAPQEEKPQNQDFKPFSFENAPVYKSLNQEENSEEDNRREQNRQPENFAQNNQNRQGEQTQPKNASPLIPSIPKPPVNSLGGTAEPNGTGGANNFAENFNRNNIPGAQNFQPAQNERPAQAESYEAGREAGNFGSFGNGGNSAEPNNFSNYQNYQNMPGAVPPNGANSAQPAPVPYQPVPYQPENGAQNNQNYSPVPYVDPNAENSRFESPRQNVSDFSNISNSRNLQPERNSQPAAAPFMPSIPKPPVNSFGGTAEPNGTGGANNFAENFNRNNIPGAQNFQPAQNERPAQAESYEAGREAGNFGSFGNGGNSAEPNNFSNYQNYQNMPGAVPPNGANSAQPAPVPYQPVPYQPENGAQNNQNYSPVPYSAQNTENGASAQSFSNYQEQAQALQNQGAQAFANLRSAVDENYKITLQNVVQNQQPPKPEPQAQPEIKPGANPVPYKAVPYMASSPNGELPRYQADVDEPAQKPDRQPEQRQNYSGSQNVRNNVQQAQNAAPKKGFWQKLQDAFSAPDTEPRAPNLNEPVNLRAPENASKFNQNYAAQTLRNMQNPAQKEQTAAQNQKEWADLSRQFAQNQQNQQNYSQIKNARSSVGESAREIIPPKDLEGTQFDFSAFAAKQSGSAFEAKKFSAQPLEAFYLKKQVQDNAEKARNTVNIPGIKTPDGGFAKSDNIFYKIPAGAKDSNARRVAKFLLLIGTDEAAKIIAQLPQDQVEKIVPEIASIRRVDPEEKAQILAEFQGLMAKARESGGVTTARTILEKAFGDQQAQDIMQRAVPYDGGKPFDYLQKFDGEQLTLILKDESVPVKALVLSQVKPAVAAAVINQMNEKERKETVLRLSRLTKFSPDILSRIDRTLREKAENVKTPASNSIDGRGALASILRKMDANSEKNILSNLSLVDGELESDLRKRLFTIDDVIAADDKFLQKKLHAMTDDTIAMIIHGKQPEFRKKILNNISKTRGISVLEEEDARAPYSKKELDRLTNEFMTMLRAAWEKGELMINNGDEEWV